MAAIIKIGGDTRSAVTALDALDKAVEQTEAAQVDLAEATEAAADATATATKEQRSAVAAVDKAGRAARESASRWQGLAKGMGEIGRTAAGVGFALAGLEGVKALYQKTVQFLSESVREFVATSEEAQRSTSALSSAYSSLRASIGGAIVGGRNLDVVTSQLSAALDGLRRIVDQNAGTIQALVRGALAGLLSASAAVIEGIGGIVTAFDAVATAGRVAALGVRFVYAAIAGLVSEVLGAAVGAIAAFQSALASLAETASDAAYLVGQDRLAAAFEGLRMSADRARRSTEALSASFRADGTESYREAEAALRGAGQELDDLGARAMRREGTFRAIADTARDAAAGIREMRVESAALDRQTETATTAGPSARGATPTDGGPMAAIAAAAKARQRALTDATRAGERERLDIERAAEAERAELERQRRERERLAAQAAREEQARLLAQYRETTAQMQALVTPVTQAAAGMATGMQTSADAARSATASVVDALAAQLRAQAVAAGATGAIGAAAALTVASGIVSAIAARIGGSGSGASGGGGARASAAGVAPQQVTNINVQNVGFPLDRRQAARQLAELGEEGRRMGYGGGR